MKTRYKVGTGIAATMGAVFALSNAANGHYASAGLFALIFGGLAGATAYTGHRKAQEAAPKKGVRR